MIIPKEYLKTIKRTGLGFAAFAELRYKNPVEVAQQGVHWAQPHRLSAPPRALYSTRSSVVLHGAGVALWVALCVFSSCACDLWSCDDVSILW